MFSVKGMEEGRRGQNLSQDGAGMRDQIDVYGA